MSDNTPLFPLSAVRALALHTQGLTTANGAEPPPTPDTLHDMIHQIVCLQIDTLQMIHRSHYVILWSRLGKYDPADLDRLAYGAPGKPPEVNGRRLFEYWYHAACYIPLSEYRYRRPVMRRIEARYRDYYERLLAKDGHLELKEAIVNRIQQEGALRGGDFAYQGERRGSWWDWKPAKEILEHLYNMGELMIARRVNFQRYYDLPERVLPDWVDATEPTWEEMARHELQRSLRALGACLPIQVADYMYYPKRGEAKKVIEGLMREGIFVPIQTELADGQVQTLLVHRDNLPLLEAAADGAIRAERTAFLNPFDPLFYPQDRDEQFWGFRHLMEMYKPGPIRQWGYFCLPILHRDRLVGRFDPKLERPTGTMRLKAIYLEPGVAPDEEVVTAVAGAMRDFLAFHNATELVIERSEPAEFGPKIIAAL